MEAPSYMLRRQRTRSHGKRWIIGAAIVVVLIIIIVPTAVILSRKDKSHSSGLPATVLIPLYEYPETKYTWDPLYAAINSTTDLNFIVIINPDSGPGNDSYPAADFVAGVQQLNSYSNVQTVGYVRTGYGNRSISDIADDVEKYASWSSNDSTLAMHGIFFDEAAYYYSNRNLLQLEAMNNDAKNSSGILSPNTVIHNPGVLVDPRLILNTTDITVTFEQSFAKYRDLRSSLEESPLSRSKSAYIVHSAGSADLKDFVPEMSYHAEYLYVTSNKKDYYESFGKNWNAFVDAMLFSAGNITST